MFRIEGMGMVFGKLMYIHIYIYFFVSIMKVIWQYIVKEQVEYNF